MVDNNSVLCFNPERRGEVCCERTHTPVIKTHSANQYMWFCKFKWFSQEYILEIIVANEFQNGQKKSSFFTILVFVWFMLVSPERFYVLYEAEPSRE